MVNNWNTRWPTIEIYRDLNIDDDINVAHLHRGPETNAIIIIIIIITILITEREKKIGGKFNQDIEKKQISSIWFPFEFLQFTYYYYWDNSFIQSVNKSVINYYKDIQALTNFPILSPKEWMLQKKKKKLLNQLLNYGKPTTPSSWVNRRRRRITMDDYNEHIVDERTEWWKIISPSFFFVYLYIYNKTKTYKWWWWKQNEEEEKWPRDGKKEMEKSI